MFGFDRVTFDPNVMGGKACIRGMRVTVSLIVNLVANGMTTEEIIEAYPYLEPEDIQQALSYVTQRSVYIWSPFPQILSDIRISPASLQFLCDLNWLDAVHLHARARIDCHVMILEKAQRKSDRLTHDLDFGELVAASVSNKVYFSLRYARHMSISFAHVFSIC